MNNALIKGFGITALAAAVAACGGSGSGDSTGTLSFGLTDAPVDSLKEVNVAFTKMSIKPANGDTIEFTFDAPKTFDLLELQGGNAAPLLGDSEVPAGDYNWVKLELDTSMLTVVDDNGGQFDLTVPSSEIKLVSGFIVPANASADFTIDFDVRKSITDASGPNDPTANYIMKPALRLVNNALVGSISGTVDVGQITSTNEGCTAPTTDDAFAGAVYVFERANVTVDDFGGTGDEALMAVPVTLNDTKDGYIYKAAFLTEGTYTVSYTCNLDDVTVDEDLTFVGDTEVNVVASQDPEEQAIVNF